MTSKSKTVVITGVSRKAGIGFALAEHFLQSGYRVFAQSWPSYDSRQSYATHDDSAETVLAQRGLGDNFRHIELDLADPSSPAQLVRAASDAFGGIDGVVVNHAASIDGELFDVTAESLDAAWAVNARASILIAQEYARAHGHDRTSGRIVYLTSGQHLAPMTAELPYAMSKAAIQQMIPALADCLAERGITVNAVNPGPNDTGWASGELYEQVKARFPQKRWGTPADVVPVIDFLMSDDAQWITGQTLNVEGGFRRFG